MIEGAFAWLSDIMRGLLRWVPRIQIVNTTEGGVAFVRGKPKPVMPGRMLIFWPVWTEVFYVPVNRQTIDLRSQTYLTADDKTVAISGVVVYDVPDAEKAILWSHNHDDSIRDLALASVVQRLHGMTLAQLRDERDALSDAIRKELRAQLRDSGINIRNFFLSDLAPCTVIRVLTDGQTRDMAMLPEPKDVT